MVDSAYYYSPSDDGSVGTLTMTIANIDNPGSDSIIVDNGNQFTIGDNGLTNWDPLIYQGEY